MSDSDKEDDFIALDELTKEQWSEVHSAAVKAYHNGEFDKDMFKCTIKGFLDWLLTKELEVYVDDGSEGQKVH